MLVYVYSIRSCADTSELGMGYSETDAPERGRPGGEASGRGCIREGRHPGGEASGREGIREGRHPGGGGIRGEVEGGGPGPWGGVGEGKPSLDIRDRVDVFEDRLKAI